MTNTDTGVVVPAPEVARYAAPRVGVVPVTEVISAEPQHGRMPPGHYQSVLLSVRTGELRWHESTEHLEPWDPAWQAVNDVPREIWTRWHPGHLFSRRGPWGGPVPELLSWTVDSGVKELPYLDAAAATALLEELAPYAQALLDGLLDAAGDLDWSAAAVRAGRNIGRLCSRYRQAAAPAVDADLVDYAEVVRRCPQVYSPSLLALSLDTLAERCAATARLLGRSEAWHPEIKTVFGMPYRDGSGVDLSVLGIRAWYRTVLLDGDPRPVRDFAAWDAEHGRLAAGEITASTTDAELDAWADNEVRNAADRGLRLLGARDTAAEHRTQVRAQDWDRLAVVGADVAEAESRLEPMRAERQTLVADAIRWGRSDSEIAARARISRQAVNKVRERLATTQ